jgi:hypothetical protein
MAMITATSRENITGSPAGRTGDVVKTYGEARAAVARQPAAPRCRFGFTATTPGARLFPRPAWAHAVQRMVAATLLGNFPARHSAGGML